MRFVVFRCKVVKSVTQLQARDMENELRNLVRLYEEHRCLWDSKIKNYHNKNNRDDAWKKIALQMGKPREILQKKMTALMGTYRREKSRQKKSTINGSGTSKIYKSKWFAFEWFQFLTKKNTPILTMNTKKPQVNDGDSIHSIDNNTDISSISSVTQNSTNETPCVCRKKRKNGDLNDSMREDAFKILNDQVGRNDVYSMFGQYIAQELRKYDERTLVHVKRAITNVIFDADLGLYGEENYDYYTRANASSSSPNNFTSARSCEDLFTENDNIIYVKPECVHSPENTSNDQ